jgi:hypothetical protein
VGLQSEAYGVQSNGKSTLLMVDLGCAMRHLVERKSPIN